MSERMKILLGISAVGLVIAGGVAFLKFIMDDDECDCEECCDDCCGCPHCPWENEDEEDEFEDLDDLDENPDDGDVD